MRRTIASEWGKAWSVRAPWICLVATVLLVAVTAFSLANDFVLAVGSGEQPPDATLPVLSAVGPAIQAGQLVFAAFALQLITAEYSTGAIRSTLQAQPRRYLVLLSKSAIAALCGVLLGAALGSSAAVATRLVLGDHLAKADLSLPEIAVRTAAALGLVAVMAIGLGAALRSAVGTLAATAALLLGTLTLPPTIGRYAPGQAIIALLGAADAPYAATIGGCVLAGWAAVALAVGAWLFERRDA